MTNSKFPPTKIQLASNGFFYPTDNILSQGWVELYAMTAREEDLLTNRAYIVNGTVLDKLLEALIATPGVKYNTLLTGDKDTILVAARILSFGKMYATTVKCSSCDVTTDYEINLEQLEPKNVPFLDEQKNKNLFTFILPKAGATINFRLLTHEDEKNIKQTIDGYSKSASQIVPQITTMMKRSIININGNSDKKFINEFVDNMLVQDSRSFRKYASSIAPGIDWTYKYTCPNCGTTIENEVEISHTFFWPEF